MKMYSKEKLCGALAGMKREGRMSHGFLLTGERGVGKKTSALYIASLLMCENPVDGAPCGVCRHCRRIENGTHPDVIIPERSGKKMIYTRDTVRALCSDAFTMPNDCDAKAYILPDCENIEEATQNLMLKLIEEPPDFAYFIFTAPEKSVFLPTILSRVITFGIPDCTEEDCRAALAEEGKFTSEQIDEAVAVYHGNIGMAKEFISGGNSRLDAESCKAVVSAMVQGSEYAVNKALTDISDNRERVAAVLTCVDKVIRDACIIRLCGEKNPQLIGCCPDEARALSVRLSFRRAEEIHSALCKTAGYFAMNVNPSVAMPALSSILSV